MKAVFGFVLMAFSLFGVSGRCVAGDEAPSVETIVARSNHASLYQGADCQGTTTMTITDKQGRVRKRQFNMLRKNGDTRDKEQRYFVYFIEPSDVRKMVFMVHKHVGLETDDDRWLYMPSLDLVKRIAASDKRTSFVGSDYLYEDISGRGPEEDTHELLETTDTSYVVKNTPKKPDAVEFASYVAHIDKTTFLPMKIEYFKADNRPYRVIEVLDVASVEATENGARTTYPTVVRSVARDLEGGGRTEMVFSNVRYNIGLTDELFTERYLRRAPKEVLQ
ncbi:outer membrane lipoprotein-sorting protein [Desulfolutivibrio sulfoxidireducens]|uniref:outer membrane lipoprotein-sorting protein n=1 Tax=Desulfolutivibrio sulfoxidireducens TaxID=2773299 RepID=UPI00159E094F|nr:outer membrane lipoprotein-sorting protein [Desulfolutivibrio sulfoxidireducens]QLA15714.1 outer membrane lipoprotein-sorting protein [Desulfolutivibrio sulfoxidireducens]